MINNLLNLLIVYGNPVVSDAYRLPVRNGISQANDAIDGILPFINEEC